MNWRRELESTSPLSGPQFFRVMQHALADASTTLDETVRLARRVVDERSRDRPDVAWMASVNALFFSPTDQFLELRLRELAGTLTVSHDDEYVLAMVSALGVIPAARTFLLRSDDALRENVFWRIFEVEGGGEVSLTNIDKIGHVRASESWHTTVLHLVDEGIVPRDRVLRASLSALQRDFASYTSGWFSRLFAALQPTADELTVLQPHLLALLSSQVGPTVTLAVRSLHTLHRNARLDIDLLAEHAASAMLTGKANVVSIITMLRDDYERGDVHLRASVIAEARDHPHPDVRSAVRDALAVLDRLDLLPDITLTTVPVSAAMPNDTDDRPETVIPWPASELTERLGALLARNADGIEFELALAALATLEDRSVLRPLAKIARRRIEPTDSSRAGERSSMLLSRLVLRALGEPFPVHRGDGSERIVVGQRAKELGVALARSSSAGILLSTPEDRSGRISPDSFADRLLERDRAGYEMLEADLVAALLRLSASGRGAALKRISSPPATASNDEALRPRGTHSAARSAP